MLFFSTFTKLVSIAAIAFQATYAASALETQALTAHNKYRARHHVSAVKWNQTLAQHAASVANTCVFAHKVLSGTGQNLALGFPSMTSVVDAWYSEVVNYNYTLGPVPGKVTGHFTQVVWKGTTDIGCASKYCSNLGGTMYVCDYSPPGNYGGQYTKNVFKP